MRILFLLRGSCRNNYFREEKGINSHIKMIGGQRRNFKRIGEEKEILEEIWGGVNNNGILRAWWVEFVENSQRKGEGGKILMLTMVVRYYMDFWNHPLKARSTACEFVALHLHLFYWGNQCVIHTSKSTKEI